MNSGGSNKPDEFNHETLIFDFCHEDNSTARQNLALGAPIYYRHDAFQDYGLLVKEYPSGRIELVKADDYGNKILIKVIKE